METLTKTCDRIQIPRPITIGDGFDPFHSPDNKSILFRLKDFSPIDPLQKCFSQ